MSSFNRFGGYLIEAQYYIAENQNGNISKNINITNITNNISREPMEILAKMFRWCHRSKKIVHLKTGLRTEVQYSIFCVRGGRV